MANAALPKKGTDMQKGVAEVLDFIEPDYLKDPVACLYLSGWRSGEMKSLEWRDVGAEAIRLRAEKSKNKKPRVLPLRGSLWRSFNERRTPGSWNAPFVFHDDGQPIGDFARHGITPASVPAWAISRRSARDARQRRSTTDSWSTIYAGARCGTCLPTAYAKKSQWN